jgi:hypothetical protein
MKYIPTISVVLSVLVWIFASMTFVSIFGDFGTKDQAELQRLITRQEFRFNIYVISAGVSFISSIFLALCGWRFGKLRCSASLIITGAFVLGVVFNLF